MPTSRTPFRAFFLRPAGALAVASALLLSSSPDARAQGFVLDAGEAPHHGGRHPAPQGVALRSYRVSTTIRDHIASTRVHQVFENRTGRDVEATYVFPIPPGASCADFSMIVGGREMKAEVLDRDKARGIYEEIVRRRKDPALLELIGNGLVRARVFPVPARGAVEVRFTLEQSLDEECGVLTFRHPIRTDRFSIPPAEELSILVDVESRRRLASIHSPSHRIDVARSGEKRARVSLEERGRHATEDFSLVIGVTDEEFGLHLVPHRSPGEDGFFQLLLSPARDFPDDTVGKKDFVFVLDTSGSMQGAKFEQATGALRFALSRLREGDRFALVPFSTEARPFRDGLVAATRENVEAALAFVGTLSAVGGTNIADALRSGLGALAAARDASRVPLAVFLTDGLPTVSETDPKRILEEAGRIAAESRCRLFVFGVGNDVNALFLDRLAEDNSGSRDYVTPGEDIEVKVGRLVSKIESPVLSDLRIAFDGVAVRDVHPKSIPDLFRGQQVSLVGRYAGEGRHRVTLTGTVSGRERTYVYEADFSPKGDANATVARLWAERRVGFLLDEIRLRGENRELRDEVERLSKRYGIVTPYTAFLITEDERLDRDGNRRLLDLGYVGAVQPAPDPAPGRLPLSGGGRAAGPAAPGAATAAPPETKAEIGESLGLKRLREADRASAPAGSRDFFLGSDGRPAPVPEDAKLEDRKKAAVRAVGAKVFERAADGTWTDTAIAAAKNVPGETRVVAWSKEYFELVERVPALKPFFALGDRVKVLHDGMLYAVAPPAE